MPDPRQPDEIHALHRELDDLRGHLARVEAEMAIAKREAQHAREEVLHLRDQVVAAERDQQDLRTARARLARPSVRGWMARVLSRQ